MTTSIGGFSNSTMTNSPQSILDVKKVQSDDDEMMIETKIPSMKIPQQQKRRSSKVSFGSSCKCHDGPCHVKFRESQNEVHKVVPRISSFSEEELSQIWFEGDDFQDFKEDCRRTLDKIERGKVFRDRKYTSTGLEKYTEEGRQLRHEFRENAYDAIMYGQQYQYETLGKRNSLLLALDYKDISRQAHRRAVDLAIKLRKDVIAYLTTDDIGIKKKNKKKYGNKTTKMQKRRSSFC